MAKQYESADIDIKELKDLAAQMNVAVEDFVSAVQLASLLELKSIEAASIPTLRRTAKAVQSAMEKAVKAIKVEAKKKDLSKLIPSSIMVADKDQPGSRATLEQLTEAIEKKVKKKG